MSIVYNCKIRNLLRTYFLMPILIILKTFIYLNLFLAVLLGTMIRHLDIWK